MFKLGKENAGLEGKIDDQCEGWEKSGNGNRDGINCTGFNRGPRNECEYLCLSQDSELGHGQGRLRFREERMVGGNIGLGR